MVRLQPCLAGAFVALVSCLSAAFPGTAQEGGTAGLPAAAEQELAERLAAALAEPRGAALAKLLKVGRALERDGELSVLLAALRGGPRYTAGEPEARKVGRKKESLTRHGRVVVGLAFEHERDVFRYAVDLPDGYDPERAWPLLVDPGHVVGAGLDDAGKADFVPYFRNQARGAGLDECIVVRTEIIEQVGGGSARGAWPEDRVAVVFDALFRELVTRFHVDLDRVWVAGVSQTGFWSWYLGRHRADRLAGIAPMGAVTWQVDEYLPNFTNLPAYVLHGDADEKCPVEQPRATTAALAEMGCPVRYEEVPGGAHDFSTWGGLQRGLRWLAERPRDPYPRRIACRLAGEGAAWWYWVRVDGLAKEGAGDAAAAPTAELEASVEGQRVTIDSRGVERLTLCLAAEMLDLSGDVEVVWNGETVHSGPVEPSFVTALEVACEKADWRATFPVTLTFREP